MRFDISHPNQLTAEELQRAEDIVNEAIRLYFNVCSSLITPDEAIKQGAMALFGE